VRSHRPDRHAAFLKDGGTAPRPSVHFIADLAWWHWPARRVVAMLHDSSNLVRIHKWSQKDPDKHVFI